MTQCVDRVVSIAREYAFHCGGVLVSIATRTRVAPVMCEVTPHPYLGVDASARVTVGAGDGKVAEAAAAHHAKDQEDQKARQIKEFCEEEEKKRMHVEKRESEYRETLAYERNEMWQSEYKEEWMKLRKKAEKNTEKKAQQAKFKADKGRVKEEWVMGVNGFRLQKCEGRNKFDVVLRAQMGDGSEREMSVDIMDIPAMFVYFCEQKGKVVVTDVMDEDLLNFPPTQVKALVFPQACIVQHMHGTAI